MSEGGEVNADVISKEELQECFIMSKDIILSLGKKDISMEQFFGTLAMTVSSMILACSQGDGEKLPEYREMFSDLLLHFTNDMFLTALKE